MAEKVNNPDLLPLLVLLFIFSNFKICVARGAQLPLALHDSRARNSRWVPGNLEKMLTRSTDRPSFYLIFPEVFYEKVADDDRKLHGTDGFSYIFEDPQADDLDKFVHTALGG